MTAQPPPGQDELDPIVSEPPASGAAPGTHGPREVVAVIPAKDEEGRIGATIAALEQIGSVGRVIVVDRQTKQIIWQYGVKGTKGHAPGYLNYPDGVDIDVFRDWKAALKN